MMQKLTVFCLLVVATALFADEIGNYKSIYWQKQQLEAQIKAKTDKALSSIIKSGQYIIDVKIATKDPDPVSFPRDKQNVNNENANDLLKNGEETDEVAEQKYKIRYSDIAAEEASEDAVIFAKLGIEAPLVENFNRDDNKAIERPKTEKQSDQTKILQKQIEYDQHYDIFNNLEAIAVSVKLSNRLVQSTKESVESVIKSLSFNMGDIKPRVTIDYIEMNEGVQGTEPTLLEKIAPYNSYIYSFLIFCAVAGLIFSVLKKIERILMANSGKDSNLNSNSNDLEDDKNSSDSAFAALGGKSGLDPSSKHNGSDRFEELMDRSFNGAILLIKKWIKIQGKYEKLALSCLVHELDNSKLQILFAKLSGEEKDIWRSSLSVKVDETQLALAQNYIANQIITEIMTDTAFDDPEFGELLLQISPDKAANMIKQHPSIAKILFNASSSDFVNDIISRLDEHEAKEVISGSMDYDPKAIASDLTAIKQIFKDNIGSRKYIPFMNRVPEIFPSAFPENEVVLIDLMVNSGRIDELRKISLECCPSQLIETLPIGFMKECLQQYPLSSKVELLMTVDDRQRDTFLSIFAPPGSKAYELIDIEFESRKRDDIVMQKIIANKQKIYKSFVDFVRGKIANNRQYRSEIESIIHTWVHDVSSNSGHDNIVNFSAAS